MQKKGRENKRRIEVMKNKVMKPNGDVSKE